MSIQVAQLLQKERPTQSELPLGSMPVYCWQVRARTGTKPSNAWAMLTPELNPLKQRVGVRSRGYFLPEQAEQLGRALVELARQVEPTLGEARLYQKELAGRFWTASYENYLNVKPQGKRILVCGIVDLTPQMAWEVGSYLQSLSSQMES